jgi:hypothetical protein
LSGSRAAALALALVAAGCTVHAEGSERLRLTAPAVHFGPAPFPLRVETRGALAERPVTLTVAVNGAVLDPVRVRAGVAVIPVPKAALRAGRNQLIVKTGSERTTIEPFVVPLAAWLPALLLAAGGGVLLARRGLASRAPGGSRRRSSRP